MISFDNWIISDAASIDDKQMHTKQKQNGHKL